MPGTAVLKISALIVILSASSPAFAETPDYCRGFLAGWDLATHAVWANRNHNRNLSGYAPETQPEAMARIQKSWPAPKPPRLPDARETASKILDDIVALELDSIDLYVVLPLDMKWSSKECPAHDP